MSIHQPPVGTITAQELLHDELLEYDLAELYVSDPALFERLIELLFTATDEQLANFGGINNIAELLAISGHPDLMEELLERIEGHPVDDHDHHGIKWRHDLMEAAIQRGAYDPFDDHYGIEAIQLHRPTEHGTDR